MCARAGYLFGVATILDGRGNSLTYIPHVYVSNLLMKERVSITLIVRPNGRPDVRAFLLKDITFLIL